MRVGHRRLLQVFSCLFSVALAIAVNVATCGQLPAPPAPYDRLAVGVLVVVGVLLAVWQWRPDREPADHAGPRATFEFLRRG